MAITGTSAGLSKRRPSSGQAQLMTKKDGKVMLQATHAAPEKEAFVEEVQLTGNIPPNYVLPTLTISQIRSQIPAHCFERDALRSLSYVLWDGVIIFSLWYLATYIDVVVPAGPLRWLTWAAWQFVQGCFFTGWWVLAHECGHRAFSNYAWLDNTVGYILHSFLLVPYYSWQISHGKHHHHTGHVGKDQVFIPPRRSQLGLEKPQQDELASMMQYKNPNNDPYNYEYDLDDEEPIYKQAPIVLALQIVLMWTVGWPGYLIANMSGQDFGRWTNHYDPKSPIFDYPKQAKKIILSDLGVLMTLAGLAFWGIMGPSYGLGQGWITIFKYYFVPYLWCNAWLVTITFLQHTHPAIPHYDQQAWNFVRGALTTIDRDYGLLNHIFHGITNTHVAHHLFSTMPHYHAWEATKILEKLLVPGKHYFKEERKSVVQSVWESWWQCRFIEDVGDVLFWRK